MTSDSFQVSTKGTETKIEVVALFCRPRRPEDKRLLSASGKELLAASSHQGLSDSQAHGHPGRKAMGGQAAWPTL